MIRQILPILLVLASLAIFFFFVVPQYATLQGKRSQIAALNEALNNSRQVQAVRDRLLTSYNNIADEDIDRLKKILPDHVDNVRLILEIDRIASRNGMVLQNVVTRDSTKESAGSFGPNDALFGKIRIGFSLIGRYESIVNFLAELEQSLRVVDVVALSFARGQGDLFEYDLEIDTYWLK
ncbi:MAG: type 4a pilus biogenesis protein PilO [Parcubacteria group bacterium]|nr:type 4a pilus biogenesis protein PilO [Parcubacteria group bacterium]